MAAFEFQLTEIMAFISLFHSHFLSIVALPTVQYSEKTCSGMGIMAVSCYCALCFMGIYWTCVLMDLNIAENLLESYFIFIYLRYFQVF